jgi:MFS family permease
MSIVAPREGAPNLQSVPQTAISGYSSRERTIIVLFAFLGTALDGADYQIFLYFMAPMAAYFHTTLVEMSFIQASSYVVGLLGGVIFGMLSDRLGRRFGLAATILMYSVCTLLTGFVSNYPLLLALRVLAGIGIGGESGIAFAYINEAFPAKDDRRGLIGGLLQTMFPIGAMIAIAIYTVTSDIYGSEAWRWGFIYLGLGGVLAFGVRLLMPESRLWLASKKSDAFQQQTIPLVEIFRPGLLGRVVFATLALTFGFYAVYTVQTYAPAMWQTRLHVAPSDVGKIGLLGSLAMAVSYVVGGWLADLEGRRWSFVATSLFSLVAFAIFIAVAYLGLVPDQFAVGEFWTSPIFWSYLLLMLGAGSFGVVGVWLSELFPTHVRTTAQNFIYYCSRAVGAGLLPLLGLMAANGIGWGLDMAIAFGVIGAIGRLIFCVFLPETGGKALRVN